MPDSHITASSEYGTHDPKHDYSAARARINNTETKNSQGVTQMGAWTADILDKNQYIRVQRSIFVLSGTIYCIWDVLNPIPAYFKAVIEKETNKTKNKNYSVLLTK